MKTHLCQEFPHTSILQPTLKSHSHTSSMERNSEHHMDTVANLASAYTACSSCKGSSPDIRLFTCTQKHTTCEACLGGEEQHCPTCQSPELRRDRTGEKAAQAIKTHLNSEDSQDALAVGRDILEEVLTCQICMALPLGHNSTIFLCPNSHPICGRCLGTMDQMERSNSHCPSCKLAYAPRPPPRDHTGEQLLAIFEFGVPCPNQGCPFRAEDQEHIQSHAKFSCSYKLVDKCPVGDCANVRLRDLLEHFLREHSFSMEDNRATKQVSGLNWMYNQDSQVLIKRTDQDFESHNMATGEVFGTMGDHGASLHR